MQLPAVASAADRDSPEALPGREIEEDDRVGGRQPRWEHAELHAVDHPTFPADHLRVDPTPLLRRGFDLTRPWPLLPIEPVDMQDRKPEPGAELVAERGLPRPPAADYRDPLHGPMLRLAPAARPYAAVVASSDDLAPLSSGGDGGVEPDNDSKKRAAVQESRRCRTITSMSPLRSGTTRAWRRCSILRSSIRPSRCRDDVEQAMGRLEPRAVHECQHGTHLRVKQGRLKPG